jgi:hypothetical protein
MSLGIRKPEGEAEKFVTSSGEVKCVWSCEFMACFQTHRNFTSDNYKIKQSVYLKRLSIVAIKLRRWYMKEIRI